MTIEVLDPRGTAQARTTAAALALPRTPRVLGVLDNSKSNADVLLAEAAAALQAGIPGLRVVVRRKAVSGKAASDADLDAVTREADLVLTGSAD